MTNHRNNAIDRWRLAWLRILLAVATLACAASGAFLASPSSRAGAFSGNGADNPLPSQGAAWFPGDRVARYCSVVAEGFGLEASEASRFLAEALEAWRDYIEAKQVNNPDRHPFGYNSDLSKLGRLKLRLRTAAMPACDGTEDLKVYFGTPTNADSEAIREHRARFHSPTAFSQVLERDADSGWAKGFIWIAEAGSIASGAPNWTLPHRLHGILLHELGHVLGNGHVRGTIMDGALGSEVLDVSVSAAVAKLQFARIDSRRELLLCRGCGFRFEKASVGVSYLDFKALAGRAAVGGIDAVVTGRFGAPERGDDLVLVLRDWVGEERFEIRAISRISTTAGDTPVFKKAALSGSGESWDILSLETQSMVYLARLRDAAGADHSLLVSRNVWDLEQWGAFVALHWMEPEGTRSLLTVTGGLR